MCIVIGDRFLQLLISSEELFASATHKFVLITSQLSVHTARRFGSCESRCSYSFLFFEGVELEYHCRNRNRSYS